MNIDAEISHAEAQRRKEDQDQSQRDFIFFFAPLREIAFLYENNL